VPEADIGKREFQNAKSRYLKIGSGHCSANSVGGALIQQAVLLSFVHIAM